MSKNIPKVHLKVAEDRVKGGKEFTLEGKTYQCKQVEIKGE